MNNRDRLIELLTKYEIERREIAAMLNIKIHQVDNWLVSQESRNYEDIPDMAIELLEIKLGEKKV